MQSSRDERLECHVREIYICSALAFIQLIQRAEAGDLDDDVLHAQGAAADNQKIDAITYLILHNVFVNKSSQVRETL